MKSGSVHPQYNEVDVECSCGNKFTIKSTLRQEILHLEICSNCHPFYTGKQKFVDIAGRIEKFENKYSLQRKKESEQVCTIQKSKELQKVEVKKEAAKISKKSVKKPDKKKKEDVLGDRLKSGLCDLTKTSVKKIVRKKTKKVE